jgi:hypothetical protein
VVSAFRWACTTVCLTLSVFPTQGQDSVQPQLDSFSFTPASVDTVSNPAQVTVSFTVTGKRSSVRSLEVTFVDPSGVFLERASANFRPAPSVTGSLIVTLPAFSNAGTWKVGSVFIADASGNTQTIDTDAIAAAGFPTTLQVSSAVDDAPPDLTGLAFARDSVDTTAAPAAVIVNFTATDNLAGVRYVELSLLSPSGSSTQRAKVNLTPAKTIAGSANFTLPRFSEAGTWTVNSAFLADAAGNTLILDTAGLVEKGFPTALSVTSSRDTAAPQLTAFSITPSEVNTGTAASTVLLNFRVTDDLSGVTTFQAAFVSPSGNQMQTASASFPGEVSVTGRTKIIFPQGSEPGTWTVASVFLSDAVGNTAILTEDDLAALGFSSHVTVTSTGRGAY